MSGKRQLSMTTNSANTFTFEKSNYALQKIKALAFTIIMNIIINNLLKNIYIF